MRAQLVATLLAVFGLGVGSGLLLFSACGQPASLTVRYTEPGQTGVSIRVYVSGAVRAPGVYPLHAGDRVVDAVEAAGGPAAEADTEAVNFAKRLQDEEHLHVPRIGEAAVPEATAAVRAGAPQAIDINRADANLFVSLPGIGATRAANIVSSREKQGPFKSTADLVQRKLLPQSVYDQVKDLIAVGP